MMDRYKPEKTSDPVMAILVACHALMPHATNREKAQWCVQKQRELQRDGRIATAAGEIVPSLVLAGLDPVMARLCAEGDR